MVISNEHMRTNDIDWFCVVDNQYPIHLASNGSIIPEFAADRIELSQIQQIVISKSPIPGIIVRPNTEHIDELRGLTGFNEDRYLESFRFFAERGFYSFDYEWNTQGKGHYKLLVRPSHPISPEEMRRLPQVSIKDLNGQYKDMFVELIQQIKNLE